MSSNEWGVYKTSPTEIHVVPEYDTVDHALVDCACGPRVTLRQSKKDGSDRWVYTHNALDGRPVE